MTASEARALTDVKQAEFTAAAEREAQRKLSEVLRLIEQNAEQGRYMIRVDGQVEDGPLAGMLRDLGYKVKSTDLFSWALSVSW